MPTIWAASAWFFAVSKAATAASFIPRYLLRDRDKIFGDTFRAQVQDMQIKEVLSAPRSPWQRAYVERVIGSIRRECRDHLIIFGEASLLRTLQLCRFCLRQQLPFGKNMEFTVATVGERVPPGRTPSFKKQGPPGLDTCSTLE
jgi:transposase InsO family protein